MGRLAQFVYLPILISNYTDIDIQLFAEEDDRKRFEPTEYRLRRAREEGNIPKSQDLASSLILALTMAVFLFSAYTFLTSMYQMFLFIFGNLDFKEISMGNYARYFAVAVRYSLSTLLPILVIAVIASIFSHTIQTGFYFSFRRISNNVTNYLRNIPTTFKRLFFSKEALVNLLKSLLKIGVVGVILFFVIQVEMENIRQIPFMSVAGGVFYISSIGLKLIIFYLIFAVVVGFADWLYQRQVYRKSLRMTVEELREELKETEGEPTVRQRIRQRAEALARRRNLERVKEADVVITNPIHYAVALKYDPLIMNAPTVIAKGEGYLAIRIREIAEQYGIPVIENKPLARALYQYVEIGQEIPPEFFEAVALIYKTLYEQGKLNLRFT